MTPGDQDLWLLPLGGCGEIGMNLNLYGHAGRWLIVDCGITFAREGEPGPTVQLPDPAFVAARRDALAAIAITHAHEDHVGAVAHLWPQLRCPVYATRFTREILRRKLREAGLEDRVPVHLAAAGDVHRVAGFELEWVALTHSTPESQALVIRTAVGTVFHTGDWKLDRDPVVGEPFDRARFEALGRESILAMVCDSTNALVPGRSPTEGQLYGPLRDTVAAARGRVVASCFGSNVARLTTLLRVGAATGRRVGLLGRSLRNYQAAAVAAGLWRAEAPLVASDHLAYLPREEVLAIATGSQGEPRAALDRLASDSHPDLPLEAGDTVVLSARVIPGNERAVASLIERFARLGVDVVTDQEGGPTLHASGHPARDELADLYRWIKPTVAVPVHGEAQHLEAHGRLARELGVHRQLVGRNGDLFMLAPQVGLRRGAAPVGRLGVERGGLVPVGRTARARRAG